MKLCLLLFIAFFGVAYADSVVPLYGPTKTERMAKVQENLRRIHAVERMAKSLGRGINLPKPITLMTAECSEANAVYAPGENKIILCLELLVATMKDAISKFDNGSASREHAEKIATGAVSFALVHELGHALIHVLDLPVLGREEDAADQLSAYILLNGPRQDAQYAIAGAMWMFGDQATTFSHKQLGDEHSLDPQRRSNLACWAIGKDQAAYGWIQRSENIPSTRLARCSNEYASISAAVRKLLSRNLRILR